MVPRIDVAVEEGEIVRDGAGDLDPDERHTPPAGLDGRAEGGAQTTGPRQLDDPQPIGARHAEHGDCGQPPDTLRGRCPPDRRGDLLVDRVLVAGPVVDVGESPGAARRQDRVRSPAIGDYDLAAHVDVVIIVRPVAGEEGRAALGRDEDDLALDLRALGGDGEGAGLGADRPETRHVQRRGDGEGEEGVERFLVNGIDPGLATLRGDIPERGRLIGGPGVPHQRAEIFDIAHHPVRIDRAEQRALGRNDGGQRGDRREVVRHRVASV